MKKITFLAFWLLLNLYAGAQITFYKEYTYGGNVILLDDGYISFTSADVNGGYMLIVKKTDLYGEKIWVKDHNVVMHGEWGSAGNGVTDPEGNIYISIDQADYDLVKLDKEGNLLWKKKYEYRNFIGVTGFNNNFLWAQMKDWPDSFTSLYKIDPANGDTLGSIVLVRDPLLWPVSIKFKDNGDITMVVSKYTIHDYYDMLLYTRPADSTDFQIVNLEWSNHNNFLTSIKYFNNEIWGLEEPPYRGLEIWDSVYFVRYNYSGNIILRKAIPWPSIKLYSKGFVINSENQVVLLCTIYDNDWFVHGEMMCMTMDGDTLWSRSLDGNSWYSSIHYCNDGGYYITGTHAGKPFALKTDSQGINWTKHALNGQSLYTYPNPVEGIATIVSTDMTEGIVKIYDIYGNLVTSVDIKNGTGQLNTKTLSAGVYICSPEQGKGAKMIVFR